MKYRWITKYGTQYCINKTDGKKVLSENKIDEVVYDTTITDCNDAYEIGKTKTYFLLTTVSNIPSNIPTYILSLCNPSRVSNNSYVTQIATSASPNNENKVWIRHRYVQSYSPVAMGWTVWKEL